jgi:hypothetical protein
VSRTAVRVRSSALYLFWALRGNVEQKRCCPKSTKKLQE